VLGEGRRRTRSNLPARPVGATTCTRATKGNRQQAACAAQRESGLRLCGVEGVSRGLASAHAAAEGEVVASLPWGRALTPEMALSRLARDERRGHGARAALLPCRPSGRGLPRPHLLAACRAYLCLALPGHPAAAEAPGRLGPARRSPALLRPSPAELRRPCPPAQPSPYGASAAVTRARPPAQACWAAASRAWRPWWPRGLPPRRPAQRPAIRRPPARSLGRRAAPTAAATGASSRARWCRAARAGCCCWRWACWPSCATCAARRSRPTCACSRRRPARAWPRSRRPARPPPTCSSSRAARPGAGCCRSGRPQAALAPAGCRRRPVCRGARRPLPRSQPARSAAAGRARRAWLRRGERRAGGGRAAQGRRAGRAAGRGAGWQRAGRAPAPRPPARAAHPRCALRGLRARLGERARCRTLRAAWRGPLGRAPASKLSSRPAAAGLRVQGRLAQCTASGAGVRQGGAGRGAARSEPGAARAGGAAVSLDAFTWAHCLVRSRALDLTAAAAGGGAAGGEGACVRAQCMLPLLDLCNHAGARATAVLRLRLRADGQPRRAARAGVRRLPESALPGRTAGARSWHSVVVQGCLAVGRQVYRMCSAMCCSGRAMSMICGRCEAGPWVSRRRPVACAPDPLCAACPGRAVELVAARALAAGDALTLDYGARPLRALLQGYAFVPADAAVASPSEARRARALGTPRRWHVQCVRRWAASGGTNTRCCPRAPSCAEPRRRSRRLRGAPADGALTLRRGRQVYGDATASPWGRHCVAMGGAHRARLCSGAGVRLCPPRHL